MAMCFPVGAAQAGGGTFPAKSAATRLSPSAAGLTWMFADKTAGSRKRIVFSDQADGVGIAAFSDQSDITRNINFRRTKRYTGNRLMICTCTASLPDMLFIVFTIADQSFVYHVRGFVSDRAIGGIHDGKCKFFHHIQCLQCGFSVQHVGNKMAQLSESDPAWSTFAACLGMAHVEESSG